MAIGITTDIKPGSQTNPVNPGSPGLLPAAVLSSDTFDATEVDPDTLALAGAPVAHEHGSHIEDVNEDGLPDLVVHFDVQELDGDQLADGYLVITGITYGGVPILGGDTVTLVPWQDVGNDHWALEATATCMTGGIVSGYPDGLYRPDQAVTRDQMAVYIARGMTDGSGPPTGPATPTYPDVPTDQWAYDSIEYVTANDVVGGYPNGYYRPEYDVSRDQMAVFVARARSWIAIDDDMATAPELFPDVPAGHWAGTAIEACVDNEVVQGYPDGRYRPNTKVTRDQMAVYVARAFDLLP
jgi:hypothetical protein